MANSIKVKIGELARPLRVKSCKNGTTLTAFLAAAGMGLEDNILVNAERKTGSYRLRNGDLITTMGHVSGGI